MEIRPDDVPVRYLVITPAPHGTWRYGRTPVLHAVRLSYGSLVIPPPSRSYHPSQVLHAVGCLPKLRDAVRLAHGACGPEEGVEGATPNQAAEGGGGGTLPRRRQGGWAPSSETGAGGGALRRTLQAP